MQRFFFSLILLLPLLTPHIAASEPGDVIRIAFLGDFLPAGSAKSVIENRGYGYLFDGVRDIIESADAVVLNLETPISLRGSTVPDKAYTFRASPEAAQSMSKEGVKAVWLANNHIMDFGPEALADTMKYLEGAGIAHAGAGLRLSAAYSPANIRLKDHSVSLLAYSNTFPEHYWARKNRPGTAFGSPEAVKRWVSSVRKGSEGPVLVSFHWGAELMTEPKDYQVDLAHLAIESGASLVVGHHSHVPQPVEVYRGVPVLYSLGNFAFGSYSRRVKVGLLAVAEFAEDGRCRRLVIYPLLVDNYEVHFRPRPIKGSAGRRIFNQLVNGIVRKQAEVMWDGEKGIIIPMLRVER
jgi:poly-gamma-glutamate synthesis protein (capsule biosynthesis protein)